MASTLAIFGRRDHGDDLNGRTAWLKERVRCENIPDMRFRVPHVEQTYGRYWFSDSPKNGAESSFFVVNPSRLNVIATRGYVQ